MPRACCRSRRSPRAWSTRPARSTPSSARVCEDKLAAFEQKKGTQIVMLMVPTTQPEDIASYANRVGNAWKIGRKEVGDGVLLVVAKDDRKVRIEVAKTLEGAIPDLAARQIIDEAITPHFRRQRLRRRPARGRRPADRAASAAKRCPRPSRPRNAAPTRASTGSTWRILLFFAVPVGRRRAARHPGRKLGALATGGGVGVVAMLITSSLVVAAIAGCRGAAVLAAVRRRIRLAWQRRERRALSSEAGAAAVVAAVGAAVAVAAAGEAPAVAATSGAAAPRGTGDGAGKELATHPRPLAAASLAGRSRHPPGRSRPTLLDRLSTPCRRQRKAPQRRDPHLRGGRPALELPAGAMRRRASGRWRCSASCASGTPSTTTAC